MNKLKLLALPLLLLVFLLVETSRLHAQQDVNVSANVDNENPTITVTNPSNGATVSGTVEITADAADDGGITKVEFFIDGFLKLTDISSPYTFSWGTKSVSNGSRTITAKVTDIVGNTAQDSITVTVNNVTMTSPTKKFTPLSPVTPIPTKPTDEKKEAKRKFLIFPNFPGIGLAEGPIAIFKANSNFFYGFSFSLELILLYWIIKKFRKRRKDKKDQETPKQPPTSKQKNFFRS